MSRPILITIIGILFALSGLVLIISGALMIAGSNIIDLSSYGIESVVGTAGGIAVVVMGLIPFVIGYGILKGWKIMWYIGVIFSAISLLVGLVSISILSIIIDAVILYYMFRPGVKEFFGL